jgi:hypothetical protein
MPRSLKGRGVVSDTPTYEEGAAAAPGAAPRRTSGGGGDYPPEDPAVEEYLAQAVKENGKTWREERTIIGKARAGQDQGGFAIFNYEKNGRTIPYAPVLHKYKVNGQWVEEPLDTALKKASENSGRTPLEIIEEVSEIPLANATPDVMAQAREITAGKMRANQELTSSHLMGMAHGAGRAAQQLGVDLMGESEEQQLLAMKILGLEKDALASRFGATTSVRPPADIGMPSWMPRMNNLSPVQTGMAYGALAAGTGAAGLALANHLIAQGQQQANPVEYAAAMQALNAYA